MDWLQLIILSVVQGITEFLPVSSSAHLVLPAQLTDWPDQGLAFDVGVHFGTLLAVIVYFRGELLQMSGAAWRFPMAREWNADLDLIAKLALATLPIVIVGLLAKEVVETHLRSVLVIASTTVIFGIALWIADRKPNPDAQTAGSESAEPSQPLGESGTTAEESTANISWVAALLIGCAQIFALIPGTSRSGVTITAALFLGLGRTLGARFSFLLAIPTIAGAQLLLSLDLAAQESAQDWRELLVAAALSGLTAYFCIRYFIALVERTGMLPYVIYRLVLGLFLFGIYFTTVR